MQKAKNAKIAEIAEIPEIAETETVRLLEPFKIWCFGKLDRFFEKNFECYSKSLNKTISL